MSTTVETTSEFPGFEYLDLNQIDPSNKVPTAVYRLKIVSAALEDHVSGEKSKNPGKVGKKVKFSFAITEGDLAGRRVFSTIYESKLAGVHLRKLADATGVAQASGEAITSWLNRLVELQPDFKAQVKDGDFGNEVMYNTAQVAE